MALASRPTACSARGSMARSWALSTAIPRLPPLSGVGVDLPGLRLMVLRGGALTLGSRRPLLRLELRLLGAPAPGGRFVAMCRHGGAPFLVPLGSASPRGDGQG